MKFKNTLIAVSVASLALFSTFASAHSEEDASHNDIEPVITIAKAMKIAKSGSNGNVTSAAEKHYNSKPVFVVLVESNNQVSQKMIDGLNGDLLGEIVVKGKNPQTTEFLEESVFEHQIDLDEQHGEDEDESHH